MSMHIMASGGVELRKITSIVTEHLLAYRLDSEFGPLGLHLLEHASGSRCDRTGQSSPMYARS